MSDSLRDQLLKAGFAEPKAKPPRKQKPKAPARKEPANETRNAGKPQASGAPANNQPKAGYTHVAAPTTKKKKKQKAPAIKPRSGSWSTREPEAATDQPRRATGSSPEAQRQKRMKAEIQEIIDSTALKQFKGEEIYRFTLQNKIRELLVSEPVRKQLVSGELAITRLNGVTRIIPSASATRICTINPQWLVFISTDVSGPSDEDDEFPIPDDLVW